MVMKNIEYLGTVEGQQELTKAFDLLLRKKKFEEVKVFLSELFKFHKSKLSLLAKTALDQKTYTDPDSWKALHSAINAYDNNNDLVKAIGLDLAGNWDWNDGTPGPGLEINYYYDEVDRGFKFSEHSDSEILTAAKYPCPWQGAFIQCESFSPVYGLDELYNELCTQKNLSFINSKLPVDAPKIEYDPIGFFLGLFVIHLKMQKAISSDLSQYGLPKKIPVLLGTNDFLGQYEGYNVLFCKTVKQLGKNAKEIQLATENERVEELKRRAICDIERFWAYWSSSVNSSTNASIIIEKSIKIKINEILTSLSDNEIYPSKNLVELTETEFREVMNEYYKAVLEERVKNRFLASVGN